jgi:peptide/nickel transport system substrate-binding protein
MRRMPLMLLMVLGVILSACRPAVTETAPARADLAPTQASSRTEAAPRPRNGGWLDEIGVSVVGMASAIEQVQAGAIHLYSSSLASDQLEALKAAGLGYSQGYGGNYALMFNPAAFSDTTRLNPFVNRKIREAMNWAIDRDFINQQIYGGGSLPKYFPITTNLVDYTDLLEQARALEARYAYALQKARQVIDAEMPGMGAALGADGKWTFNGQPIVLVFLIRNDGDGTSLPLGDYFASQLETLGFTVDRQYQDGAGASAVWIGTDPAAGQWHVYTAGWLSPGLTRDEKDTFQQMYAPNSIQSLGVFLANTQIDPEFQQVADDLAYASYATPGERHALMGRALELSLQDSLQVWVIDQLSYSPFAREVQVTYDLGSGVEAAAMNPYNMRFTDQEGGVMQVGTLELFAEPWNTVSGSSRIADSAVMRATTHGTDHSAQGGMMGDPYTGLAWPQRIASAEVTAQAGLPIVKTLDWLEMNTADRIDVPADTWVDWDAAGQQFVTAAEKFPGGTTARIKSVVTYPEDLFDTVRWHTGSPLSVADFIMPTIVFFDRGKSESAIFDESAAPNVESVLETYKGFRITSTDPLTIESYSDLYYADAELDVVTGWPTSPTGLAGENAWEMLTISNLAEIEGEVAYSFDKAGLRQIEQTNWIGGPSLEILAAHLDKAIEEQVIPYQPTLGQYITAEQAEARYENLRAWYEDHGHFWVGTGPYYLDTASLIDQHAVLRRNLDFPDPADRWSIFSHPKLASVTVSGPAAVTLGDEALIDISVMAIDGSPYSNADVKHVKYLLFDATGAVAAAGAAASIGEGRYQVTLDPALTTQLIAGNYRLEVAVVPIPVAIPAYGVVEFAAAR